MRVPVQPIGWPRAMAPPFTLSLSGAIGTSRVTAITCGAKASLSSTRSTASTVSPVRACSFRRAGTGPMPITRGSTPALAQPSRRATGVMPCARAHSAELNTTAAPPSVMPEAEPAVMIPGWPSTTGKVSGSLASPSSVDPGRGCSSMANVIVLPRSVTVTGTISASKWPCRWACSALRWLSSAKASDSARVMPYWRARISAVSPMMRPDSGHEKPSRYIASTNWKCPILWPHRASAASTRYGMRLIDSMPPATTTDDSPSRMLCAPEAIACRPEAQALLMVWAGAPSGRPARCPTCRAGFGPEPACRPCPISTSSTAVAGTPARASAARTATAPSSAGWVSLKVPP